MKIIKWREKLKVFRLETVSNETKRLIIELNEKENIIISNQNVQNKIGSLSMDACDHLNLVNQKGQVIKSLIERLNDPDIDLVEHDFL
jgi:transcription antitermination factor NusA-like protein